ncbi:helix-turn-helix domain-containing protein [Klebsiella huaxiensis]|uniref:AraC family transcriptional regulator n=1 Tax=Klebsiella huaxiensis TaxID=2153354 RepID=A0ABT6EIZ5_9ENTR|nr:AraC family transcriptional regulator [Klebsiella huaxiensis]MDG1645383.1 AraC family transcriptional regulator [Klebsiella huaxiensis]QBG06431.1 helix-turn-helix domain-containing protein [Klebsiella huaxiensis]VUS89640.1 Right origin-binding protein [Klebsiella huaxiensis]
MNDTHVSPAYAGRFQQVCLYIERHLDKPLSLETLSAIAHSSPYHFHRQFSAYSGVPLYRYIQWLRLRRACWRLAFNPQEKIIDIALDAGFQNPESFSRAFRSAFAQSPSQFRQQPDWREWHRRVPKHTLQEQYPMDVNIIQLPTTQVAMLRHRGSPDLVNETAGKFIAWRKVSGLSPVTSCETWGVSWDDPAATPAEDFRFDICGTVNQPVPENAFGVVNGEIPGGRCAVVRHHGSLDTLAQSIWFLYRDWLPASGESLRDFPVFFRYLNFVHEVGEHELQTDVYLPLN